MFSRSVSDALLFLRTVSPDHAEAFKDTAPTQEMCAELNEVFDILNGRHPKDGLTRKNWIEKRQVRYIDSNRAYF